MLIRTALQAAYQQIDPFDARLLLQTLLGVDHVYLIAHDDKPLTAAQSATFKEWVERAAAGEPIPYITGQAPFYGRTFTLTPDVLIPRPETEFLVEEALKWGQQHSVGRIIDVGTGSGCIPVTLWCEWTAASKPTITAVDLSAAALAIAQQNAQKHGAKIDFMSSDLLTSTTGPFDIITANLPYITDDEWTHLEVGVKSYEPAMALRGGSDGLMLIRPLLEQARAQLAPTGLILLEIGWQQGANARAAAVAAFPNAAVSVLKDYAGHDRLVKIETKNHQ